MKRRTFISTGITGAAAAAAGGNWPLLRGASAAAPAPAVQAPGWAEKTLASSGGRDVGTRAQLFIDQHLVQTTRGVAFTPHAAKKHPLNPLVRADRPWEGWRINIYGTAFYDEEEGLFKMWYMGDRSEWFPDYATHYAVSRDGVHWEKPSVGTLRRPGLAGHNAVVEACQIASVFKDAADPDRSRRYKMIEWSHAGEGRAKPVGGPHAGVSPDGLHWTRVSRENLFRSNDVVTAFYDPERKIYVAIPKFSVDVRGRRRRCFAVTATRDFLNWPDPRLVLQPDLRDDAGTLARIEAVRGGLDVKVDDPELMRTEFYGVGTYLAESCVVGFPWIFSINNNARFPTDPNRTFNHEGPCEIQLAVSRDLQTWERPFRTPVIPLGGPGEWDSGFLTTASQAFRHDDQVWLYYGGGNYAHGCPAIYDEYQGSERGTKYTCSIGLARWPLDRFVSADGGADGGILTTVPLHVVGRRLELNLDAQRGQVVIEPLDPAGRPLAGFGRSDPLTADSLRATVTWKGKADLSALAERAVSLRFELRSAQLFSFAFRK